MDPERNAVTLQRLYDEVMNGHNVDAADELITVDRPDNDATFPPEFTAGRAGFQEADDDADRRVPRPAVHHRADDRGLWFFLGRSGKPVYAGWVVVVYIESMTSAYLAAIGRRLSFMVGVSSSPRVPRRPAVW